MLALGERESMLAVSLEYISIKTDINWTFRV